MGRGREETNKQGITKWEEKGGRIQKSGNREEGSKNVRKGGVDQLITFAKEQFYESPKDWRENKT